MKNKIIKLLLCAIIAITALTSCEGLFGGGNSNNNDVITFNKIIRDDETLDVISLRSAISDVVNSNITINTSDAQMQNGEIVLGDTSRPITLAAKAELEKRIAEDGEHDCGYIVYTDGKSIAVYWQIAEMYTLAINKFVSVFVEENRLTFDSAKAECELFVRSDYEKNKYWITLENTAPAELVSAFKRAYTYYDGAKLADWVANLYDPERGGFYFSISARDYDPFRPDLESTAFAINVLVNNGALKNRNTDLPDSIKIALVDYARNLQSKEDGYFYHPQWPQDKSQLKVDRYGRDLASASDFITSFKIDRNGDGIAEKQYPKYCIPGAAKCALHDGTDDRCTFPQSDNPISQTVDAGVSASVMTTVSAAVSKLQTSVVKPVVSSHPDYSSAAAFRAWLLEYNASVKENSGNAHNIAELRFEIIQYGYMDIVLDHLDNVLEEIYDEQMANDETPSGAWQRTADYRAVWGVYKYLCLYNLEGYGRRIDIKYVPYMVDTCIKVLKMEADGDYHINDIMNQWTAIGRVITNVKKYYGDDEVKKIYEKVRLEGADLVYNTLDKIEPFKIGDGSFAYNIDKHSPTAIYGVQISRGDVEGDLNATVLATGTYRAMYTTMGYTPVPLCSAEDGKRFVDIITTCSPVEKEKVDLEAIGFENDEDMDTVTTTSRTPECKVEITEDPEDSGNRVLYFASGTAAAQADAIAIRTISNGSGCNVFEFDMYVDSQTDDGYLFQVKVGSSYIMAIHKNGNKIEFKDLTTTDRSVTQNFLAETEAGKWFRFRGEYYLHTNPENGIETPKIKIFLDGEYVTTSECYRDSDIGANPTGAFASVSFYSMRLVNTHIYLDNCYLATETKYYSDIDHTISDGRGQQN